jgi:hypothetical protein
MRLYHLVLTFLIINSTIVFGSPSCDDLNLALKGDLYSSKMSDYNDLLKACKNEFSPSELKSFNILSTECDEHIESMAIENNGHMNREIQQEAFLCHANLATFLGTTFLP